MNVFSSGNAGLICPLHSRGLRLAAWGALAWAVATLGPEGVVYGQTAAATPPAQAAQPRTAQPHAAPTFAKVVEENFTHWDLNHDGKLEAKEIDQLMNRKGIHKYAAAALATIKRRERMEGDEYRREFAPSEHDLLSKHLNDGPLQSLDPAQGKPAVYHFESQFRHNLNVLGSINRKLYAGKGPNFAAMHQGSIGDCFFFSVAGSMAARDPHRLVRMIVSNPDGGYEVHLGDEVITVAEPSDAEILLNNTATSIEDGLWLTILEEAVGRKMRKTFKPSERTAEATDAIAYGGSTSQMMEWCSGHETLNIHLRDPAHAEARLARLRQLLPSTLSERMLATVSMGSEPAKNHQKIPELGYGHAYAIFEYDPKTDHVTLWNPWGNDFTPTKSAGVEHGYPTKHGIFRIPLKTLYDHFSSVHLETSKPASPDKTKEHRPHEKLR